jgi:hypothetical protein
MHVADSSSDFEAAIVYPSLRQDLSPCFRGCAPLFNNLRQALDADRIVSVTQPRGVIAIDPNVDFFLTDQFGRI